MIVIIITVIFTGLAYVLAASFINENNSKTWLSGYNTMSKAEQDKFDLKGYLGFIKPFLQLRCLWNSSLFCLVFFDRSTVCYVGLDYNSVITYTFFDIQG